MSESKFILREVSRTFLDELIGEGAARKVYSSQVVSDCVIKVEETGGSFQNVIEWQTWNRVKDTSDAKWFAPCVAISPCGSVLVQKKTKHPLSLPTKLPAFLSDHKPSNYGMYEGRLVCHDYGWDIFLERGLKSGVQKVEWVDDYGNTL